MEKYFGAEWLLRFTTTVAAAVFFLFFFGICLKIGYNLKKSRHNETNSVQNVDHASACHCPIQVWPNDF